MLTARVHGGPGIDLAQHAKPWGPHSARRRQTRDENSRLSELQRRRPVSPGLLQQVACQNNPDLFGPGSGTRVPGPTLTRLALGRGLLVGNEGQVIAELTPNTSSGGLPNTGCRWPARRIPTFFPLCHVCCSASNSQRRGRIAPAHRASRWLRGSQRVRTAHVFEDVPTGGA